MAKIYDQNQKNEPGREMRPGHEHAKKSGMMLLIGIVVALVIIFMLYRRARGEEFDVAAMVASAPIVSSFYVTTG
jgi:hypothetical protein